MAKAVLMSLNPKWVELILQGLKEREVRKRAPLLRQPFKVYLYCTKPNTKEPYEYLEIHNKMNDKIYKANGYVVGEATCVSITEFKRPFGSGIYGTCLSPKELYEYAGSSDKLSFMALENQITYPEPVPLSAFGLTRPPQSWQYVEEIQRGESI